MAWNCYLTIFKAESPIHIGYKQIGILKTTRYYITGRAMWGAITANLTRSLFDNPTSENYREVGDFVRKYIKTTYFYPAIEKNKVKNSGEWSKVEVDDYLVFLPKYTDDGLKFGEILKNDFEQIFVGSFISTALDASTKTAEEGSLHEFEFIKNKIKFDNEIYNIFWIGYLFIKEAKNDKIEIDECGEKEVKIRRIDNSNMEDLTHTLGVTQVGGERNYGLGRLRLNRILRIHDGKVFGKDIELNNKDPIFKNLAIAIAHVNLDTIELGEIEPIVGLEWSNAGAGQKVSKAEICATPGSRLKGDFILCDYGILKRI